MSNALSISATGDKIPSLDGIRGISILLVIFHHATNDAVPLLSGHFGVSIFFVISGYLITTLLLQEEASSGEISLKNFYIRRVLRIFPVAYLYLAVLLILNFAFQLGVPYLNFVSSALYIRNTSIIEAPNWYTGHYWSLSVEEQFYLIFPFILQRSVRAFTVIAGMLLLLIPVSNYLFAIGYFHEGAPRIVAEVLRNLGGPLVGSLMAVAVFRKKLNFNIPGNLRSIATILLFFTAAVLHTNILISLPAVFSQMLIAAMILVNITPYDGFMFDFLNWRVLRWIGVLSYSLYIWQQMFTFDFPWANVYPPITNSIWLNVTALFAVAYLSYTFFEKPFLALRKRFTKPGAAAIPLDTALRPLEVSSQRKQL